MTYTNRCSCGALLRGSDEEAVYRRVREHSAAVQPARHQPATLLRQDPVFSPTGALRPHTTDQGATASSLQDGET